MSPLTCNEFDQSGSATVRSFPQFDICNSSHQPSKVSRSGAETLRPNLFLCFTGGREIDHETEILKTRGPCAQRNGSLASKRFPADKCATKPRQQTQI